MDALSNRPMQLLLAVVW